MNIKSHVCQSCFLICEEAKQNLKKLEKKLYVMTIVCTATITLLGEQGAKSLMTSLNTINSAMSAAEGKNDSKEIIQEEITEEENKKKQDDKHAWDSFKPISIYVDKPFIKKYEMIDELSRLPKKEDSEKDIEIVKPKITNKMLASVTKDIATQPPLAVANNIPQFSDNHAVFFSPSLLPFDVYSNTLALGNNYGFGEYYGIYTDSFIMVPQPGPAILTGFAVFVYPNRRRIN